jgi:hypothetical protein
MLDFHRQVDSFINVSFVIPDHFVVWLDQKRSNLQLHRLEGQGPESPSRLPPRWGTEFFLTGNLPLNSKTLELFGSSSGHNPVLLNRKSCDIMMAMMGS